MRRLLADADAINKLAVQLSRCQQVTNFDSPGHREAPTIAYAFSELEESFMKFMTVYLPRLLDEHASDSDIFDLLHETGEELRHVLYHIGQPEFYSYLSPRSDEI